MILCRYLRISVFPHRVFSPPASASFLSRIMRSVGHIRRLSGASMIVGVSLASGLLVPTESHAQFLGEVEPNNSFGTATPGTLAPFTTHGGRVGNTQRPGETQVDYWLFEGVEAGLLQVSFDATSDAPSWLYPNRVLGFDVFTSSGELVASYESGSAPDKLIRKALELESGNYFFKIYADIAIRYELKVSTLPPTASETEPNDEFANPFELWETRYGRFDRPVPEEDFDIDFFYIRASESGHHTLELTAFGASSGYVFADFLSETGNLILGGLVWEGDQTRWDLNIPEPGLYFLALYGSSKSNYAFRMFSYPHSSQLFETEPNDIRTEANPLRSGTSVGGQISRASTSQGADYDRFYFIAMEAGEVYVSFGVDGERWTGRSLQLQVTDSQGTELLAMEEDQGESGSASINVGKPGVYYLRVQGTSYEQYGLELRSYVLADVPGRPSITAITEEDGALLIDGEAPDDGGAEIRGYIAECSGETSRSATLPIRVTGLTNGRSHSCFFSAFNEFGVGMRSFGRSATPRGAPFNVRIISVVPENGGLTFHLWADRAGGRFPDYTVTCGSESATNNRPVVTVWDLEPNEVYSCSATARNEFGVGIAAENASGVPLPATTGLPLWLLLEAMKPTSP